MFSFVIMGFVDIVGVVINYLSNDFPELNESFISLLASSCFIWFLFLSVPAGLMVNRIGRRKSVLVSLLLTAAAFSLASADYSIISIFAAFSLAGIGCTVMEVSLFPLVTNIVSRDKITGTTALGQLIRTLSCLLGPILVNWFAVGSYVTWKAIFPVYAVLSLISFTWLAYTKVPETRMQNTSKATYRTTLSLFHDKAILTLFIGMLVLISIDVGVNTTFPKYLRQSCGLGLDESALGNSVFFLARIIGGIAGSLLLFKMAERKIYLISIITVLIGLAGTMLTHNPIIACTFVFILGLGYSNIFAIILSSGMKKNMSCTNAISSLMIMGISGGAILPPIMTVVSQTTSEQWTAILVMAVVWLYMFTLIKTISHV